MAKAILALLLALLVDIHLNPLRAGIVAIVAEKNSPESCCRLAVKSGNRVAADRALQKGLEAIEDAILDG